MGEMKEEKEFTKTDKEDGKEISILGEDEDGAVEAATSIAEAKSESEPELDKVESVVNNGDTESAEDNQTDLKERAKQMDQGEKHKRGKKQRAVKFAQALNEPQPKSQTRTFRTAQLSSASSDVLKLSISSQTGYVVLPGFKKELPAYTSGATYWNKRYRREKVLDQIGALPECYCSTNEVADVLKREIQGGKRVQVLEIGCGLMPMCLWLEENLETRLLMATDASPVCVGLLRKRFRCFEPHMQFLKVDAADLRNAVETTLHHEYVYTHLTNEKPEAKFHYILDKGTLDCLFMHDNNIEIVDSFIKDLGVLLHPGGKFISVTGVDPSLRTYMFPSETWTVKSEPVQGRRCFAMVLSLRAKPKKESSR